MNTVGFNDERVVPPKVVCIGRNYAKHVAELNNAMPDQMVVFIKTNAAISSELASYHQEPLHYEGEISFLIKNGQYAGVGFGLDLTKRQLQSTLKQKQLPWERAKGFAGAAVFNQFVALPANTDMNDLSMELYIDDVLTQSGGVGDMLFKPDTIIDDLKSFLTLEDNDVIMTGTPEGVGQVTIGSIFKGRILLADEVLVESTWQAI